jgi:hypothetical protein
VRRGAGGHRRSQRVLKDPERPRQGRVIVAAVSKGVQ